MIGVTHHAAQRARTRYGVEMSASLWAALAESLGRGEHRRLGRAANGCERYSVHLVRTDGSSVHLRVVFSPTTSTIVTVLPPHSQRRRTPPGGARRSNRR